MIRTIPHELTLPELLDWRCRQTPEENAFFRLDLAGNWQGIHWQEFCALTGKIACFLYQAGIEYGMRVGVMAHTSLEWEVAQMGSLTVSAVVAGIDPNYPEDQLVHIMEPLQLSALFVQDQQMLARIPFDIRTRIKLIILFEGKTNNSNEHSWEVILARKERELLPETVSPRSQDLALIVFSSGTSGIPKAITYRHDQVMMAITAILSMFPDLRRGMLLLCWLPLANLFQRIVNFCALHLGAVSYLLSDPRTLPDHVRKVNPDILVVVPKVLERFQNGINCVIKQSPWPLNRLINWIIRLAHTRQQYAFPRFCLFGLWKVADRLLLKQLRMVFGSRIKYFISGSAATPLWLLEWYDAIGIPVYEAYGVSENIIPIAMNFPDRCKKNSVGQPLSPNKIRINSEGEVVVSGPGVFVGYLPGLGAGTERWSETGEWLTNDLGYLDDEGFLTLTGRKSDVFKTLGGKWVAPAGIESELSRIDYVENCLVFQSSSQRILALLVFDKVRLEKKIGNSITEKESKACLATLNRIILSDLQKTYKKLAVYQYPRGLLITFEPFSLAKGELTVNLKLRRSSILQHYSQSIDQLAAEVEVMQNNHNGSRSWKPVILII